MTSTPTIVLVDDDEEDAGNSLAQRIGDAGQLIYRHPHDVDLEDLGRADLVLVDYELKAWKERPEEPLALSPRNGLALASVLREHLNGITGDHPRAVALYTAEARSISGSLPTEVRGHAIARLHDLEWVFEKQDPLVGSGIVALANSVAQLPREWPDDSTKAAESLKALLSLGEDSGFGESAWEDVLACHPPLHELSQASHTIALLRWLAHRILPYPSCLIDAFHLSRALRLEPSAFLKALESSPALADALRPARYEGILADFLGPRWWRTGVDQLIWSWTGGDVGGTALSNYVAKQYGSELPAAPSDPVVVVNERYASEGLRAAVDAVRIRPDDWPSFADVAWGAIDLVSSTSRMRALTLREDIDRLTDDHG